MSNSIILNISLKRLRKGSSLKNDPYLLTRDLWREDSANSIVDNMNVSKMVNRIQRRKDYLRFKHPYVNNEVENVNGASFAFFGHDY